jgi:hypothetical protein
MRIASILLVLILPLLMGFMFDKEKSNPYLAVTNDRTLIEALDCLDGTSGEWARKAI